MRSRLILFVVLGGVGISNAARGDDLLNVIVDKPNATGGKSIAAFGYDPSRDEMFVTAFGASGDFGNPAMRRVTNVSGAQTSTPVLSEAQLQLYYRDGNPDRGVSTPLQSGLLLNPQPVGAAPAYSFALITDAGFTRLPSSTTTDPAVTKRVYSFNLQSPPPGGDGRDIFTTRATLANMQTAAGTTATTSNQGRQFAWAGNGQSIYFLDSSTAFGGVWKLPAAPGGTVTRLLAGDDLNTEPAVVSAGGTDRIYFRGGGTTGNLGGIDFLTHDGTTTGTRQVAVSAAAIKDFLELPSTSSGAVVASMSSDAEGNVYFNNTASSPQRRGLYRLDPQGRLAKVAGYSERKAAFGGTPNSNMLRQQPRTINFTGPEGTFPVMQILYAENHLDAVAAVNIFKTGDFNRDNVVDGDDVTLFKPVLTARGITQTSAPNLKFDLNGNDAVDWKDVKTLQQFYPFDDGDADINRQVNYGDLDAIAPHYLAAGKLWTQGDFTGDDLPAYNDLELLANNWDLPQPTAADFDARGYTGQYRADLERAFNVPEPAGLTGAAALAVLGLRRHRRRRRDDGAKAHRG